MIRLPPRATCTCTLFPFPTRFRVRPPASPAITVSDKRIFRYHRIEIPGMSFPEYLPFGPIAGAMESMSMRDRPTETPDVKLLSGHDGAHPSPTLPMPDWMAALPFPATILSFENNRLAMVGANAARS